MGVGLAVVGLRSSRSTGRRSSGPIPINLSLVNGYHPLDSHWLLRAEAWLRPPAGCARAAHSPSVYKISDYGPTGRQGYVTASQWETGSSGQWRVTSHNGGAHCSLLGGHQGADTVPCRCDFSDTRNSMLLSILYHILVYVVYFYISILVY